MTECVLQDYLDAHGPASDDGFVKESEVRMEEVRGHMMKVIDYIDSSSASKVS